MRRARFLGILISVLYAAGVGACAAEVATCPNDREHVAIASDGGAHCFRVKIADTPAKRQLGLMWVRQMDSDRGMLFLFDRVAEQSFWMRNTFIPLDIIFIAPDGRIVNIAQRTKPHSEESIPSAEPVAAVLEINGGLTETLGVEAGDVVRHPALGDGPGDGDGRP